MSQTKTTNSIDPAEINHFSTLATTWWDEDGPYKALHQMNPLRLTFIRDHITQNYGVSSLAGLSIIDVGCGGGLLSEPLNRMGARVTGVDATAENINFAREHAAQMGLNIDYKFAAIEDVEDTYDVVVAMEIVEHVADVQSFLTSCAQRLKPGGLIFLSTINRTWKSYLLGIIAAEHILNWVPKGTHQWNKFVTPGEINNGLQTNGIKIIDHTGVILDPLRNMWIKSIRDGVNYMLVGKKYV